MIILTTKYDIGTVVADIVCVFSRQKIVMTNWMVGKIPDDLLSI